MSPVLLIDSPVHGVYTSPNTPGSRIPSHGTDDFGETYAIDFVGIPERAKSTKAYRGSLLKYLFQGIALEEFYGWGREIYSPVDGLVVEVINAIPERDPVSLLGELRHTGTVTKAYLSTQASPESLTGNCVIIQVQPDVYALLAHLQEGSILVKKGELVHKGQFLARLGHSGNSTMPHLHMQFMDSLDFQKAKGLPFAIRSFERWRGGQWTPVSTSLPGSHDIVRYK